MARMPRPWRRKGKGGAWFAQINGQQVKLAGATVAADDARVALAKRLAGVEDEPDSLTVNHVVARFLGHAKGQADRGEIAPDTLVHYTRHLKRFALACGLVPAVSVTPARVIAWLDSKPTWGSTMRAGAVAAVKRAFRWAKRVGLITTDPIVDLERPRPKRDARIPDEGTLAKVFGAVASPEFALFLRVLFETGCRRSEAMRVEARDIEWSAGRWVRQGKTTWATGKPRIVHLPDGLVEVLRKQAKRWPSGPILRNTRGKPWTETALNRQVWRLKQRLPKDAARSFTMRSLRHLFITQALLRGVPLADVSELAGHANAKITTDRYSHLLEHHEHLRKSLSMVRGQSLPAPLPTRKRHRPKGAAPSDAPYQPSPPSHAPARKPQRRKRGT